MRRISAQTHRAAHPACRRQRQLRHRFEKAQLAEHRPALDVVVVVVVVLMFQFYFFILVNDIAEGVNQAYDLSKEGDVILLSPACASWDQYRTFEERGNMFRDAVHKLL